LEKKMADLRSALEEAFSTDPVEVREEQVEEPQEVEEVHILKEESQSVS
jgi:hypothetical protein